MNPKTELIYPPFSDGTNSSNVRYIATSTAHATEALPSHWHNCWVEVQAEGADCWVLFGSASTIAVDRSAATTTTTLGDKVFAGTAKHYWLPNSCSHVSTEAGSAAVVRLRRSEPLVPQGTLTVTGQ